MNLLNYSSKNLDSFLKAIKNTDIKIGFNNDGTYDINDWGIFKNDILKIQEHYFNHSSSNEISNIPPIESHPYINISSFPNNHKTLVLGTFPPPSYLHNNYEKFSDNNLLKGIDIDSSPILSFFYGNRGSLWDIIGLELDKKSILNYLENSSVFVSDIILFTQRISLTINRASDNNYVNIIPNLPLINYIFKQDNSIQNIVFTSKKWRLSDGGGRGRRGINYIPKSISFSEENSAISIFFRTILSMGFKLGFQKIDSKEIIEVIPENFNTINREFTDLFAFNLIVNNRVFLLNIGDSPSGNAFTPFDSSSFMKWIKSKYGEAGVQIVKKHPRNSRNEKLKRERKGPIQKELNYPENKDICFDFQNEFYSMFFERNFEKIKEIQLQKH